MILLYLRPLRCIGQVQRRPTEVRTGELRKSEGLKVKLSERLSIHPDLEHWDRNNNVDINVLMDWSEGYSTQKGTMVTQISWATSFFATSPEIAILGCHVLSPFFVTRPHPFLISFHQERLTTLLHLLHSSIVTWMSIPFRVFVKSGP